MANKLKLIGKALTTIDAYPSLVHMYRQIAKTYPNNGITYVTGRKKEVRITYKELLEEAQLCLGSLQALGVRQGDYIMLAIEEGLVFYKMFWACLIGGIIPIPVSSPTILDKQHIGEHVVMKIWEAYHQPHIMIDDAKDFLWEEILAEEEELSLISTSQLIGIEHPYVRGELHQDNEAYVEVTWEEEEAPTYTSLTHDQVIAGILGTGEALGLSPEDCMVSCLPTSHPIGLWLQHFVPMGLGMNTVICDYGAFIRSPYLLLEKINQQKGTCICGHQFVYEWLTNKISHGIIGGLDLSSLDKTIIGGQVINKDVMKRFAERFSPCGYQNIGIIPAYVLGGIPGVIATRPPSERTQIQDNQGLSLHEEIDYGVPVSGVQIRIAYEDSSVEENTTGQIEVKGKLVTASGDEWIPTGNQGYISHNHLVVLRNSHSIIQIRDRSYAFESLMKVITQLEGVQSDGVTLLKVANENENEQCLVFVYWPYSMDSFLPVRAHIIHRLDKQFQLKVDHVIPLMTLPRNWQGKIHNRRLLNQYSRGAYADICHELEVLSKAQEEAAYVDEEITPKSKSDLEAFLMKTWATILEKPHETISLDDEFYTLGGNSIKAYQLLGIIEEHTGLELGVDVLVTCRTIRQIMDYLDKPALEEEAVEKQEQQNNGRAIAITGLAVRFPQAHTLEAFYHNLISGQDCIRKVSAHRKQLSGCDSWDDWIGEVEGIDSFDHDFFHISEEEAIFMDPQHRMILEVAYEALEDAGMMNEVGPERKVGVYSAINANTYYQLIGNYIAEHGMEGVHPKALVGNCNNIISARISHEYNFTGPALAIDTACSSSLVALHEAVTSIRQGNITGAVVTGANILATPLVHQLAHKGGITTTSRCSKVFDEEAEGTVLGEGVFVFYVEPLEKAVREKKNIYGVIRGSAVNNDGYSLSIMAPNPKGQYEAIAEAYKDGDISPSEVSYVEAHGTGTVIGDPIEIHALGKVFGKELAENGPIGIGAVKTNIGHLLPASGGAGLTKLLLCMQHKKMVPSLHMSRINPALEIEKTPFHIVKEVRDWTVEEGKTRIAGISSFGLGGTNAHMVIEEWQDEPSVIDRPHVELLTLSAKTPEALEEMIRLTQEQIEEDDTINIHDLAYSRNRYRPDYNYRWACIMSKDQGRIQLEDCEQSKYNRLSPAKIGLLIGDIDKTFDVKDWNQQGHVLAQEIENMINKARAYQVDQIVGYSEAGLKQFCSYYVLGEEIQRYCGHKIQIMGQGSGRILAQALNHRMEFMDALALYFTKGNVAAENEDKRKPRIDIMLTMGYGLEDGQHEKDRVSHKYIPHSNGFNIKKPILTDWELMLLIRDMYLQGVAIDWECIHPNGSGRIIHLPAYPFKKNSIWLRKSKGDQYE